MRLEQRRKLLKLLVNAAGSSRKAVILIKKSKGVAPSHTAIFRASSSETGSDYMVQTYIDDLLEAMSKDKSNIYEESLSQFKELKKQLSNA